MFSADVFGLGYVELVARPVLDLLGLVQAINSGGKDYRTTFNQLVGRLFREHQAKTRPVGVAVKDIR